MNTKQIWTLLTVCTCLGACSDPAFDEAIAISDEYADVAMVNYSDPAGLWRIYDRPGENRMKIGPSLARTFGGAFGPEVTFVPPTMGETRQTAQSWLSSRGRPCMITNGRLLAIAIEANFTQHLGRRNSCLRKVTLHWLVGALRRLVFNET